MQKNYQLSYFSLLMKARHYSRRILNKGIKYNLYSLKDSSDINITHLNHLGSNLDSNNRVKALNQLIEVLDLHKDAKMILRIYDDAPDSRSKSEAERLEKTLFRSGNGSESENEQPGAV